jgi:hypothetical protein
VPFVLAATTATKHGLDRRHSGPNRPSRRKQYAGSLACRERNRALADNRTSKQMPLSCGCLFNAETAYYTPQYLPSEFMKRTAPNVVEEVVQEHFPLNPAAMEDLHERGNVVILSPLWMRSLQHDKKTNKVMYHRRDSQRDSCNNPSFLLRQFGKILQPRQMEELIEKWDKYMATNPKPARTAKENRSSTPSYHFGVWRRYSKVLHIAADSRSKHWYKWVKSDNFLRRLREYVARKIASLLAVYEPQFWQKQKR